MTRRAALLAGLLALAGIPASAQTQAPAPAHLSVVDGDVTIERGVTSEPATINMALVPGDRLRTGQGRVELILDDGSAIHVDERSLLDLNSERVLRLLEGRIIILAEAASAGSLQVDSTPASVRVLAAGEYRLSLFGDGRTTGLDVAVVRGEADVAGEAGSATVRAGYMVSLGEGQAPTWPVAFNTARLDAFVEWSEALTDSRRASASSQYLPSDLSVYSGSLDRYGTWGYQAPYGYVWYPRVAPGWRPYYEGRWRWTFGFGWTWVGGHPWSWPTHHYGRWGFSTAGSWYWIPSRIWSTAWVHWAVAPGYVGWCPLGWNNRPVLDFWGYPRPVPYRGLQNPWYAWSVVSTGHFRGGAFVHHSRVPRTFFAGRNAPAFVVQKAPPNIAVPRGSAGGEVATRDVAVPRGRRFSDGTLATGGPAASRAIGTRSARPSGGSRTGTTRDPVAGVIYHRGRSPASRASSPADAYDRAGVAVPRRLPASPARVAPAAPADRPGTIRSRGTAPSRDGAISRPVTPRRRSSSAVSRPRADSGSSRGAVGPPARSRPSSAPRGAGVAVPRGSRSDSGAVSSGRPSRGGPAAGPTSGGSSSRATPSSRGSSPRAGAASRGRASGTAVPRRGGSGRPN